MIIKTLKDLFNNATPKFKEAVNKCDFNYCYEYIWDRTSTISLISDFTELLLLKHDINPLDYMEEIPKYFLNRLDIESFIIPNNIKSISFSAFEGCTSLTSIEIPESVISIGNCVFDSCTSLKKITIPNSVECIGWGAFAACNCTIVYNGTEEQWKSICHVDTTEGFNGKIEFLR